MRETDTPKKSCVHNGKSPIAPAKLFITEFPNKHKRSTLLISQETFAPLFSLSWSPSYKQSFLILGLDQKPKAIVKHAYLNNYDIYDLNEKVKISSLTVDEDLGLAEIGRPIEN